MKKLRVILLALVLLVGILIPAAPAQAANVWGCPSGIACIYTGYNGGGTRLNLSVGVFGVNNCISLAAVSGWNNVTSSVTVDYGSSLDLILYDSSDCNEFGNTFSIQTGLHVTFAGSSAWFDNKASSFQITDIF